MKRDYSNRQAYFVGGGMASLAGAVYLVRDCDFPGENIHIIESMPILGGSNDGAGNAKDGYITRGGRMLNEETYENTWDLLSSIPSLDHETMSVTDEILAFDHAHPLYAKARLINKEGEILDVMSMGFDNADRIAMGKLLITPEATLDNVKISDWFSPHFFETNFWYLWQTIFAFQKWSSLFEFKRYMGRMILEFSRIQTMAGVTKTPYNQYESIILPIKTYLDGFGVDFIAKRTVTDLDFKDDNSITVTAIHYQDEKGVGIIPLQEGDICIVTLGCMTDNSSLGSFQAAATYNTEYPISGELWAKIAAKKQGLGNPEPFFSKPDESNWESFTCTFKGDRFVKLIEQYTHNKVGTGMLMTFKESNWLMSMVVCQQPHFKDQPDDVTFCWGYALYTGKDGDYVKKPMRDCTGEEIFTELLHHLHFDDYINEILASVINVIPCMMPYTDAHFLPRAMSDRPKVVPDGSTNLGLVGQYVEIPEDMVFTEEYSVRGARIAVYTLLGMNKKICPVTPYKYDIRVLLKALNTSFR